MQRDSKLLQCPEKDPRALGKYTVKVSGRRCGMGLEENTGLTEGDIRAKKFQAL